MDDPKILLQQVRPSLAEWGIAAASIELISHSENIVYKVTAEDATQYALRIHRPGYHSLEELKSEQSWTDALLHAGVRVPRAYPANDGNYYVKAQCGDSTRYIGLVGWLEGQPLDQLIGPEGEREFPLAAMREAGELCAQLHNQATQWQPPPHYTRHHLNLQGLMGEAPFWGRFWEAATLTDVQRRTLEGLRKTITVRLQDYGQQPNTYSMIHADLHEENLFLTADGLVPIDFDDSGFGWHIYDLAVILLTHSDRRDFDTIRATLIQGYRSRRDLSDEDLSMLDLFIMVRTLALIGWISARPELGHSDFLALMIDKACHTSI